MRLSCNGLHRVAPRGGPLQESFFMDDSEVARISRNPLTVRPQSNSYAEWLRYMVQSAHHDAPELLFLASLWTYADKHDGLTERQQKALAPYIRLAEKWLDMLDEKTATHSGNVVPFKREDE
jgi:hypothetical protein